MRETGTPARQRSPRKEAVRLGREIYQRDILPQVETDHFGEYVAIDVETGDWAVADTTRVAVERLRERRPDAVDVLCERVGYRALRSFGAGSLRRTVIVRRSRNVEQCGQSLQLTPEGFGPLHRSNLPQVPEATLRE